jgi:O-antigen ligase
VPLSSAKASAATPASALALVAANMHMPAAPAYAGSIIHLRFPSLCLCEQWPLLLAAWCSSIQLLLQNGFMQQEQRKQLLTPQCAAVLPFRLVHLLAMRHLGLLLLHLLFCGMLLDMVHDHQALPASPTSAENITIFRLHLRDTSWQLLVRTCMPIAKPQHVLY